MEEKLKKEVMSLPGRDRRRLKEIGEVTHLHSQRFIEREHELMMSRLQREVYDPNAGYPISQANDYRIARSIKLPDSVPTSAGGLNKTSKSSPFPLLPSQAQLIVRALTDLDLEIRKRYTHSSLSHETLEFPDATSIQHRLQSICYEEGLPSGAVDQCSDFVATATETYIKDVVSSLLSITRSNLLHGMGRGGARGGVGAGAGAGSAVGGRAISLADIRFALEVASCNIGYMPDIAAEVQGGWKEGVLEGWDDYDQLLDLDLNPTAPSLLSHGGANGFAVPSTADSMPPQINGVLTNGIAHGNVLEKQREKEGLGAGQPKAKRKRELLNGEMDHFRGVVELAADGWAGSSTEDRDALLGILDDCLSVG